jgi:hypothetical protein
MHEVLKAKGDRECREVSASLQSEFTDGLPKRSRGSWFSASVPHLANEAPALS